MMMVENKVQFHGRFAVPLEIYTERPVEVFIDQFTFRKIPQGAIRIIILEEPLRENNISLVRDYPDLYDYVFTYQQDILDTNPKAIHFRDAELWVSRGYDVGVERRFAISTVVGGKRDRRMYGYELRHNLWRNKELITIPKEFYLSDSNKFDEADYSTNTVLLGSKDKMFDVMFHIAIENCSIKNYYSEKLLDCIETKTVPIYYGCTNIENYFNPAGMFRVNSLDAIVDVCNQLTPEVYERMKPYLEDNKERIKGLPNYMGQLKDKIVNLLKTL